MSGLLEQRGRVLRNAAVSGEPRALPRRGLAAVSAPPAIQPLPSATGSGKHAAEPDPNPASAPHPAQTTAKTIFEEARQEGLQQGRREGIKEGFLQSQKEGYEEGRAQGLAEGREAGEREALRKVQEDREAVQARIQRLDQWLETLPKQWEGQIRARAETVEEDMVALCFSVICRFMGDKALSRECVVHAVRQAIEQACGGGAHGSLAGLLAVHVHPSDLHLLTKDEAMAAWLKQRGADPLPWVADEQVQAGGCIVRSHAGGLDARLETQLASLKEVLLRARTSTLVAEERL